MQRWSWIALMHVSDTSPPRWGRIGYGIAGCCGGLPHADELLQGVATWSLRCLVVGGRGECVGRAVAAG